MRDRASIPLRRRLRLALAAVLAISARPVPVTAREPAPARDAPEVSETEDTIPLAWLDRAITVEEAEAGHPGITDDRIQRFPEARRPFAFENPRWEALKGRMQPGDALWTFASRSESWQAHAGRSGIALVRAGKVVETLVTLMN